MAAPSYRASTKTESSATTSLSPARPAGTADGDILVAAIYDETDNPVSAPSGWQLLVDVENNASGQSFHLLVYWKRAVSEPASWTWSWTGATWGAATIVAVAGALASGSPIDAWTSAQTASAVTATPAVALVTTVADTYVQWFGANWFGGGTWTPPSGYTERQENVVTDAADRTHAAAGSTGAVSGTCSNAGAAAAVLLALRPPAGSTPFQPAWARGHNLGLGL